MTRQLTRDDVEFELLIEEEDIHPCDSFCEQDDIDWVLDQLDRGNDLAWCRVVVKCRPLDERLARFVGWDSLGGVSARDMADLDAACDLKNMECEALSHLNNEISAIHSALCGGK